MNLRIPAALNPGVTARTPARTAPTAGRPPAVVNAWRIPLGERPAQQRGLLTPFPHLYPPGQN